jgi:transposase InsO family protein
MFSNSLIGFSLLEGDSMRDNSFDRTIERNYLNKWHLLMPQYEEVKAGRSPVFKRVGDFYRHHGTCSQTFRKYYNRYLQGGRDDDLLPRRRGPKWRARREPEGIETEILACRQRGMNRYEIHAALRERRDTVPSCITIYRVLKRFGMNRRTPAMREEKRRIIKDKLGELGHVDLHQLSRDIFLAPPSSTAYIVSLIDSCSRLAWAEVVISKKALPVMFRTLKMINTLNVTYGLQFAEIMSDNGAEFASRNKPDEHPFEAMLAELGIRHRYTRPYRPQTNGKIERFWRTIDDDVIDGATFDNLEHFANELFDYMIYYNNHRPHQALAGLTPQAFAKIKETENPSAN